MRAWGRYFFFCSSDPKAKIGYMTSEDCTLIRGAIARINGFHFARDQAVGDMAEVRAAINLRQGGSPEVPAHPFRS